MKQVNGFPIWSVFLLAWLASSVMGCRKETTEDKGLTIKVLTYNVAGLPEGISSSHPATYSSQISPLLNDYHIIHMQEDFCYHDSILLHSNHPYRTQTTGCVPGGDGLNTLSDFPINNLIRQAWTDCTFADCLTPKGFSYSQITLPDGQIIDFYNVHCNAGSSATAMQARRANIKQICQFIDQHSTDKPVIVMGDFNCRYTRSADTIRAFLDRGFHDVWIDLIRGGSVPDPDNQSLMDCNAPRTKPTCERVDKVFFRTNNQTDITPLDYRLDDEKFYYQGVDTLPLSDHWPVAVSFNIKKK